MHIRLLALLVMLLPALAMAQGASVDTKKELAAIAQLEKEYKQAKAAFEKNKKSAPLKKAYGEKTLKLAEKIMYSPALAPRDKYPQALRYYREVLTVDPKNKKAKESIDTIEKIYKSMGRPVPK
jgi:tetratricopeptide (TPR) repeat protein